MCHTRGARTEAAHMHRTTCDTRLRLLCIFCRRWARVLSAQKLRRISSKLSRIQAEIVKVFRRFRCKKHCRAQGNLRDLRCMHQMIVRMFCHRSACVCGCDRADFQKFQRENRAVFDRKTARFWRKKSAPHAKSAHRSSAHALHNV